MRHFLITRFNDYFPTFDAWDHATRENPHKGIEEDWLRHRIDIFNNITVPSVKCQIDKDFTWIIKCHPRTPDWAKKILNDPVYFACYDEMEMCRSVDQQASFTFGKIIRNMTDDREIITTRLDSDDAISKSYIGLVKKFIQKVHSTQQIP